MFPKVFRWFPEDFRIWHFAGEFVSRDGQCLWTAGAHKNVNTLSGTIIVGDPVSVTIQHKVETLSRFERSCIICTNRSANSYNNNNKSFDLLTSQWTRLPRLIFVFLYFYFCIYKTDSDRLRVIPRFPCVLEKTEREIKQIQTPVITRIGHVAASALLPLPGRLARLRGE